MSEISINRHNVGRIAERIVSNELESRGFRVSDLNKEGTSANSDLLAAKDGKTWQIQVKGASKGDDYWWVNYGYAQQETIEREKKMYNSVESFYRAQIVVLDCVESAHEYKCVVLPVDQAEKAAQLSIDHSFRNLKKDGSKKKPGKVWAYLEYNSKARVPMRLPIMKAERDIITKYIGNWDIEKIK
jgi:hypothetical protein